ncbi:Vacuolar protein sorting-associated protein 53, partial [Rhizopus stolonifer]
IFITKYLIQIFKCKPISEIGAEQLLLDTHSIKTFLLDIPSIEGNTVLPNAYSRIVNKGIAKVEAILKTAMSPIEPAEGYVENYLLLIGDKHVGNFTRLLDLKGIKKQDQNSLIDMFHKRLAYHDNLVENSRFVPAESLVSMPSSSVTAAIPSSITTSLTTMASTAASNFNKSSNSSLSPTMASPTENGGTRGRLNENFRKLVMTGMAFRKDLQERRDHS